MVKIVTGLDELEQLHGSALDVCLADAVNSQQRRRGESDASLRKRLIHWLNRPRPEDAAPPLPGSKSWRRDPSVY